MRKNSKLYGFRLYVFKKLQFFFRFFKKDYTFYTKKSIFYNVKFRENQLFSNIFTFLSVIRQNFGYLRILGNFRVKTHNLRILPVRFKKIALYFLTKKSIFYNERCSKFRKNQLFSNIFTF